MRPPLERFEERTSNDIQRVATEWMDVPGEARATAFIALLALGALAVLVVSLALARWARRNPAPKARRGSYERGARVGQSARPLTTSDAVSWLATRGARVEAARDGRFVVHLKSPRKGACGETQGLLAGLFESAWACSVAVEHAACGGRGWRRGPCTFVVARARMAPRGASGAPTSGARPRGGASIRGS